MILDWSRLVGHLGIAVPAVIAAPPGLLTAFDLPLVTGRELVR
ncbi:MAG: hypothetical protein U5K30_10520 [Acidimicrobiales bacterium]|nr:hypothetical protein [Acidimicrobiales bacterium]